MAGDIYKIADVVTRFREEMEMLGIKVSGVEVSSHDDVRRVLLVADRSDLVAAPARPPLRDPVFAQIAGVDLLKPLARR